MSQRRCLVVEDSPIMLRMLVDALARIEPLEIVEATDGLDALRKLAQGPFDLVVTDVNMPGLDGLKLIRRLRTDPAHKDVPIVVVTTEGAEADRQRALDLGATAYLVKPVRALDLVALARAHLGLV